MPTSPSPRSEQLGTPDPPAIRFTRGTSFGASWFTHLLRPVRLLAPPVRIRLEHPAPGGFYFQVSNGSVALPVARYDYNSDWTPCMGLFLSRSFSSPSFFLRQFLCSIRKHPFLRPRPAAAASRRAQELSRLVASSATTHGAWP